MSQVFFVDKGHFFSRISFCSKVGFYLFIYFSCTYVNIARNLIFIIITCSCNKNESVEIEQTLIFIDF